jgi:hypothetical protein
MTQKIVIAFAENSPLKSIKQLLPVKLWRILEMLQICSIKGKIIYNVQVGVVYGSLKMSMSWQNWPHFRLYLIKSIEKYFQM